MNLPRLTAAASVYNTVARLNSLYHPIATGSSALVRSAVGFRRRQFANALHRTVVGHVRRPTLACSNVEGYSMPAREKDAFAAARAEFPFPLPVYRAALSAHDAGSEQ